MSETYFPQFLLAAFSLLPPLSFSLLCREMWWLNQQVPGVLEQAGFVPTCVQWGYCVTPGFGVFLCPYEGRDNLVEIHTATPKGLSVFPLLYSLEFYSFFVWEFSGCLMISLASTPTPSWPDVYNSSIWTSVDLPVLLLNMWYITFSFWVSYHSPAMKS